MVAAGDKGRCFTHGKQKQHSYSAASSRDTDGSENVGGLLRHPSSISSFKELTNEESADAICENASTRCDNTTQSTTTSVEAFTL